MGHKQSVAEAATPLLESGETIEVATTAAVGKVSLKRQFVTAAAAAVLSAGLVQVTVLPKICPVVLTNRRLLVLDVSPMLSRPVSKLLAAMPRDELRATPPRRDGLLVLTYDLARVDGSPLVQLKFPLPSRKAGRMLAESLGVLQPT
jgi:hypothetical protein